jgi:ABC-2 type transport system ATP-binding protein
MVGMAVEIRNLRRVYTARRGGGSRTALDGIDLDVADGHIHGLLGPNGAGKTTLVKILSTVLLPTAGTARVLGYDVVDRPREIRSRIGAVFGGDRGLYARVSVRRNLLFWASLYGLDGKAGRLRSEMLIARMGLTERADDLVERLSRGMVQRVHLARGLIGDPKLVFLDEPPGAIRWRPGTSTICSLSCGTRAAPSCSPRTTWPRQRSCAPASRSSTRARS